jgi:hypothetical protein
MKAFVLAAFVTAVCASPCFAEGARGGPVRIAAQGFPSGPRAAAVNGRDGEDARQRCSSENRNIEYRDCVNASTRDPNAKIRMG